MPHDVEVLAFDVFGTLVDWRTGIARAARELELDVDAEAFADAWRARYVPSMQRVQSGEIGWATLDELHRRSLDELLAERGLELDERDRTELTLAWHRLDAWPDVAEGLARLGERFLLVPLSNGNVRLQVDLARRNRWRWDAVLGAEVARAYKPDPRTYRSVPELLGVPPSVAMLVAAHPSDLRAAAESGLRTAYVARPREHGPGTPQPSTAELAGFDLFAGDLLELAGALG